MIPAPAIIPRSISRIDATPSSSTRQLSTSALSVKRSTSAPASMSAVVLIEPSASFGTEVAGRDQLLHPCMDVEALTVGRRQVRRDVQHRVEPEQVRKV